VSAAVNQAVPEQLCSRGSAWFSWGQWALAQLLGMVCPGPAGTRLACRHNRWLLAEPLVC